MKKRPGSLRLTGGALRGRSIAVPAGMTVRPMRSRIRQSLFNILGDRLTGARVLDVFAGSGAIGIESLSRGAREAVFLERDPAVAELLRKNLNALALGARSRIVQADAYNAALQGTFEFIFLDPPFAQYGSPELAALAARLATERLADGGVFGLEHPAAIKPPPPPANVNLLLERRYGETALTLWEANAAEKK